MFSKVVFALLNINTSWIVDGTVVFNDSGDLATILFEEFSSPVADGTETLYEECSVFDTLGQLNLIAEVLIASQFTNCVVDTETSGLVTAVNTTLSDELTGAATFGVDVLFTLDVHVGVLNPGHDLFVGSHVGSEAVDCGSDETLLDEFHGVLASDTLKLALRELTRVDLDATLAATEWNISDSEFEGHERSKSLNFLKIDVIGVSCATFAG